MEQARCRRAPNSILTMSDLAVPQRVAEPPRELLYRHKIGLGKSLADIWRHREVLRSLSERQIRTRYKRALLGPAWALITPLALMVAFGLVFNRVVKVDTNGVPYALFSYLGLLPWTFFSSSVNSASTSLINNFALINKVHTPRELFPLAGVVLATFDTVLALVAFSVLFVVHTFTPEPTTVWVIVPMIVVILVATGWALILSIWTVYVRDLRYALPLALQVGLFVTPVAYRYDSIPRGIRPVYAFLNPLGPSIDGLRRCVLDGRPPDWEAMALAGAGALFVFIIGYVAFNRFEPGIADVA